MKIDEIKFKFGQIKMNLKNRNILALPQDHSFNLIINCEKNNNPLD